MTILHSKKGGVVLVWRTDVHLSDRAPRSRTDDWNTTLLGKLEQVGQIAREVGAVAVLDGGDLFHVKSPWKTSHKTIGRLVEVHKGYPCPTFGCVGNHDCVYGDYSYLPQQPLGVLFDTGTLYRLYDDHDLFINPNRTTQVWEEGSGIPGTRWNTMVRVVGVPYHGTEYDLERFRSIKKGEEDYLVVVAHVLARPGAGGEGAMFGGEDILGYDFLDTLEADAFALGHWHKDQGITKTPAGKWVINIGSLSRGSLSQDNMDRIPSVAVLNFDGSGISIEQVHLKVQPPSEVFDLEKKARAEAREYTLDSFVESLKDTLQSREGASLEEMIHGMEGVLEEVKERAILYVEGSR